jgi:hypothetical protein
MTWMTCSAPTAIDRPLATRVSPHTFDFDVERIDEPNHAVFRWSRTPRRSRHHIMHAGCQVERVSAESSFDAVFSRGTLAPSKILQGSSDTS